MGLDTNDPRLSRSRGRLQPYAAYLLDRAGVHALRLHADTVTPEHLLSALMDDSDSAACAAVLHAFADPETISSEALAISPGVMVVASDSTLPFSPLGMQALLRTRDLAAQHGQSEVNERHVLLESALALDATLLQALRAAGLRTETLALDLGPAGGVAVALDGPLFKFFSLTAKRSLSAANRTAAGLDLRSISPAHLVLGCLKTEESLGTLAGLTFHRARMVLGSRTADESSPVRRNILPDEALIAFLETISNGASSLTLLAHFLAGGTPELAQILARHKVHADLLDRARGAFEDPPIADVAR